MRVASLQGSAAVLVLAAVAAGSGIGTSASEAVLAAVVQALEVLEVALGSGHSGSAVHLAVAALQALQGLGRTMSRTGTTRWQMPGGKKRRQIWREFFRTLALRRCAGTLSWWRAAMRKRRRMLRSRGELLQWLRHHHRHRHRLLQLRLLHLQQALQQLVVQAQPQLLRLQFQHQRSELTAHQRLPPALQLRHSQLPRQRRTRLASMGPTATERPRFARSLRLQRLQGFHLMHSRLQMLARQRCCGGAGAISCASGGRSGVQRRRPSLQVPQL